MMFDIFVTIVAGMFSWTFAEYAIHNWVGHLGRGKNPFSREHLGHHRTGEFTPWRRKYIQALAIATVLSAFSILLLGWQLGLAWSGGFLLGYLIYDRTHERLHTHAPTNAYARMLRRHHFSHHFTSAKYNHGVTTRIWDRVFGTYAPPAPIKVPRKLAMQWLLGADGSILPAYAKDYQIR